MTPATVKPAPVGFNPRLPRGRRRRSHRVRSSERCFNPRLPRGRRRRDCAERPRHGRFQSAPPAREATRRDQSRIFCAMFQSAPPAREATDSPGAPYGQAQVSIRASRAGGDIAGGAKRVGVLGVSIRASRAGGDQARRGNGRRQVVSIRASRAGGDGPYAVPSAGVTCFNPRLPRGRRLFVLRGCARYGRFQSAPPAREATAG